MFLLLGIGYAKPVPINSRYFKKPRRDMALVGAAGPLSNLLMALLFAFFTKLFYLLVPFLPETIPSWSITALSYLHTIFRLGIFYNLSFMVFNLIPVPPLDGSRIIYAFLPTKALLWVQRYEQYFFWGILGFFFLSSFLDIDILGRIVNFITYLLCILFSIPFIPI